MSQERYNGYKNPIYDPKRAIPIGIVSIDPKTGWGMRLDDQKQFQLAPGQITLLRILDNVDPNAWISNKDVAIQYELTKKLKLDEAFKNALSYVEYRDNPKHLNSDIYRDSAIETLKNIDRYYEKNPEPLETDKINIRVLISDLRKKIGTDAIETKEGEGYRLTRPPETLLTPGVNGKLA